MRIYYLNLRLAFHIFVYLSLSLIFIAAATYFIFERSLQTKSSIINSNDTGVVMLDRNNKPFFAFYAHKLRQLVPLSSVSPFLQKAAVAAEDKEFYQHRGFSLRGVLRAIYLDVRGQKLEYGGSTITQQLVKNALLAPTKSFLRKYQEIVLANEIEKKYTKGEILEMYLNSIYFGKGAFGVEEASLRYFGKHAIDLNLSEASFLAGIIKFPSRSMDSESPSKIAQERQKMVLKNMRDLKYINEKEYIGASKEKLVFARSKEDFNINGTHFALMVKDFLIEKFGEEETIRSGLRVKTTIDINWQRIAEKTVAQNVELLKRNRVSNGAVVVMEPKTREVKALVGSVDWYDDAFGKVNMATSPRQTGSAFKPIVYATAIDDKVITPATILKDSPTTFHENGPLSPEYKPKNYDGAFRGNVLARRALANSLNVPSVEVLSRIGVDRAMESAKSLGITTLRERSNYGLSLVLGTAEIPLIELTNAYASFADNGDSKNFVLVTEIEDKRGKKIYQTKQNPIKVFESHTAFLISSILSDNKARAEIFGNALTVDRPAAVKTGTTENYRDAWTVGYTPDLVVGVWVGNNDGTYMDNIAGSLGAAPIWKSLIQEFSKGQIVKDFAPPEGVVGLAICSYNGLLATTATTSSNMEYFIDGTQPQRKCAAPASDRIIVRPQKESSPSPSTEQISINAGIIEEANRRVGRGRDEFKSVKQ